MNKLEKLVVVIDRYAHQAISVAAAAIAAVDPSQLPPKWAAGIVIAAQVVGLGAKYLAVAEAAAPEAEKIVDGIAGDLSGVIKTNSAAVAAATAAPDPADPNAPKVA